MRLDEQLVSAPASFVPSTPTSRLVLPGTDFAFTPPPPTCPADFDIHIVDADLLRLLPPSPDLADVVAHYSRATTHEAG